MGLSNHEVGGKGGMAECSPTAWGMEAKARGLQVRMAPEVGGFCKEPGKAEPAILPRLSPESSTQR